METEQSAFIAQFATLIIFQNINNSHTFNRSLTTQRSIKEIGKEEGGRRKEEGGRRKKEGGRPKLDDARGN